MSRFCMDMSSCMCVVCVCVCVVCVHLSVVSCGGAGVFEWVGFVYIFVCIWMCSGHAVLKQYQLWVIPQLILT